MAHRSESRPGEWTVRPDRNKFIVAKYLQFRTAYNHAVNVLGGTAMDSSRNGTINQKLLSAANEVFRINAPYFPLARYGAIDITEDQAEHGQNRYYLPHLHLAVDTENTTAGEVQEGFLTGRNDLLYDPRLKAVQRATLTDGQIKTVLKRYRAVGTESTREGFSVTVVEDPKVTDLIDELSLVEESQESLILEQVRHHEPIISSCISQLIDEVGTSVNLPNELIIERTVNDDKPDEARLVVLMPKEKSLQVVTRYAEDRPFSRYIGMKVITNRRDATPKEVLAYATATADVVLGQLEQRNARTVLALINNNT